jgi:galactose mutarotase-like enzyme
MGYLTDFTRGHAVIRNPRLGLSVALDWDSTLFPHAWYWLECNAARDFPWYRSAYVLAIEPATSMPAQGIGAVREKNGSQISIEPGESRTIRVGLTVACGDSR